MSPETARTSEEHRLPMRPESALRTPTVVTAWTELVAADPDAAAVIDGDRTVGRGRLDADARRVAGMLQTATESAPAGENRVVAVLAPHGSETVVAVLGILHAGFGYLVLDPRWPRARIDACCRAARPVAVLATAMTADSARSTGVPVVIQPAPSDSPPDAGTRTRTRTRTRTGTDTGTGTGTGLPFAGGPDSLAYLLFTSGSTGTPKAVRQSHRGVLLCAQNQRTALGLGPGDVLTLLTPFCYDMAAVDLWSALLSGAAVAPYDLATRGLAGLEQFLARHAVTVFHCAPTVLRTLGLLAGRIDGAVHTVLLGGEAAVRRDVAVAGDLFGPGVRIISGYGSTEASFSTLFVAGVDGDPALSSDAGDVDRRRIEVVAAPGAPLPMGPELPGFTVTLDTTGEILVTGPGVALGYLGDMGDRFTTDPSGLRTFRTGDLGERIDGLLYHRGRLDRQIKVRGIRVDPTEVEAILLDVPGVTGVLVGVTDEDAAPTDQQALIARLTVAEGAELSAAHLHRLLSAALPAAMVPSRFEFVDRLHVTDTGKRVRRATIEQATGEPTAVPGGRAGDPTVDRVRHTVAEVLGVDPRTLDPRSPLLESGAHSLDLVRIHAALSSWGRIQLVDLFGLGTVAAIAGHLDRTSGAPGPAPSPLESGTAARTSTAPRAGRRVLRVPPRGGR